MRFWLFIALAFCLERSLPAAESGSGTGLQISGAGDIVGTFGKPDTNRLDPREAEVVFYAPIDHLFDGLLNMAAHQEEGKVNFEIHELTFGSTKLIPRSRFRVGQFFLGIGRLNQFHRHDWPFISAPKVHSSFLHSEGVNDTGVEYSYLFPTSFYLDLTLGLTNGWVFGHAHDMGTKPSVPTHYARLAFYNDLLGGGMQTGLNYLGRKEKDQTQTVLLGIDMTAKWRDNTFLKFFMQNEFWMRFRSAPNVDTEKAFGFYLYPQYGFDPSWFLGMRFDGYSVLSLKTAAGAGISNWEFALVPTLSYKASEFSTVRAAYTVVGTSNNGDWSVGKTSYLELQAVFILGSHPAHDF